METILLVLIILGVIGSISSGKGSLVSRIVSGIFDGISWFFTGCLIIIIVFIVLLLLLVL